MTFERRVDITPSFNHIRPAPSDNYGVGACRIFFHLIGPEGAVTFQIGTDWYCQSALDHLSNFPPRNVRQPMPWDLGYHSKKPFYDSQTQMDCHLIEGDKCYYDGSTLNAEGWIEGFLNGGSDWLWKKLEEYYNCIYHGGEYPDVTPIPQPYPERKRG